MIIALMSKMGNRMTQMVMGLEMNVMKILTMMASPMNRIIVHLKRIKISQTEMVMEWETSVTTVWMAQIRIRLMTIKILLVMHVKWVISLFYSSVL